MSAYDTDTDIKSFAHVAFSCLVRVKLASATNDCNCVFKSNKYRIITHLKSLQMVDLQYDINECEVYSRSCSHSPLALVTKS